MLLTSVTSREPDCLVTRVIYTDQQLKQSWRDKGGQGNHDARKRGRLCVVFPCTEDEALALTRVFVERGFAVPTCAHYDGQTLSLYCGGAGGGAFKLMKYVRTFEAQMDVSRRR